MTTTKIRQHQGEKLRRKNWGEKKSKSRSKLKKNQTAGEGYVSVVKCKTKETHHKEGERGTLA